VFINIARNSQFNLNTEDAPRTFLIFTCAIPYTVDTIVDTISRIFHPISDSTLIIIKGINF